MQAVGTDQLLPALSVASILLLALGAAGVVAAMDGPPLTLELAGNGSPSDPYIVTNATEFDAIRQDLGAHYVLEHDIDLTSASGTVSGFDPVGTATSPFTGTLDGRGHTITGLAINRTDADAVGLVGALGPEGTIANLDLEGVDVAGNATVGGLVGTSAGVISNVSVAGSVTGHTAVGGLVGHLETGELSRAAASVTVDGDRCVGGMVGTFAAGTVRSAYATGDVTGLSSEVGGLVGAATGANGSAIVDAAAHGAVTGTTTVGGLVGTASNLTVTTSFATGSVTATEQAGVAGGLVGSLSGSHLHRTYWDVTTTGRSTATGAGGHAGATGLDSHEMRDVQPAVHMALSYGEHWSLRTGEYPAPTWATAAPFEATGPVALDEPGRYRLHTNVSMSIAADGLRITADDVHLDGGGHRLHGGILGVYVADQRNVTIRNLGLEGWYDGVYAYESSTLRVRNVSVTETTATAIEFDGVAAAELESVAVEGGGDGGIVVDDASDGVALRSTHVVDVAADGPAVQVGATDAILQDVRVEGVAGAGIHLQGHNATLSAVAASSVDGVGVRIAEGASGSRVSNATIRETGGVGVQIDADETNVSGVRVTEAAGTALAVQGDRTTVVDVTVSDGGGPETNHAIVLAGSNVTGRTVAVANATGHGVSLAAPNATVTDVTVRNATGAGLHLGASATGTTLADLLVRDVGGRVLNANATNVSVRALDIGRSTAANTTVDLEGDAVAVDAVVAVPPSPVGMASVGRFVDVRMLSPTGRVAVAMAYAPEALDDNVDPSTLGLRRHDGTTWRALASEHVDTASVVATVDADGLVGLFGAERVVQVDRCHEIAASGVFRLTANLTPSELRGGACLVIAADDVRLDGAGHAVVGSAVESGAGVVVRGGSNVTFANLTVRDWPGDGLRVTNASTVSVRRVTADANAVGVRTAPTADDLRLQEITAVDNADTGVHISSTATTLSTVTVRNGDPALVIASDAPVQLEGLDLGRSTRPRTTVSLTAHAATVTSVETPPANPAAVALGRYVAVEAAGVVDLDLYYGDGDLGDVVETTLGVWHHDGSAWSRLDDADVDTRSNVAHVELEGGGRLGLFGRTTAPTPAFVRTDLTVDPVELVVDETVTVRYAITNVGDGAGSFETVVLVDGRVHRTIAEPYLAPGERRTVSTTITLDAPGVHTVGIAGLDGPPYWETAVVQPTPLCAYVDDEGVITTAGLLEAITDWRGGNLTTDELLSAIGHWRDAHSIRCHESSANVNTPARQWPYQTR